MKYSIIYSTFFMSCLTGMSYIFPQEDKIAKTITTIVADFLECDPQSIVITPFVDGVINCYNNTDYKVTVQGSSYFAKFGNQNGKELGTSIQNEVECGRIAHEAGISPYILLYDANKSTMVSEFIKTKEEFNFKQPEAKPRYIALLHQLHALETPFPLEFSPVDMIHAYIANALNRGVDLPRVLLEEVLPKVDGFNKETLFLKNVPCHLDAQSGNVLDDGERLYLVDWECAAMCDPFFDLASMAANEEISDEEMFEFLALYLARVPLAEERQRFYQMRILADLRYCAYCYLQTKVSSTRIDLYRKFAEGFLNRIIERLATL